VASIQLRLSCKRRFPRRQQGDNMHALNSPLSTLESFSATGLPKTATRRMKQLRGVSATGTTPSRRRSRAFCLRHTTQSTAWGKCPWSGKRWCWTKPSRPPPTTRLSPSGATRPWLASLSRRATPSSMAPAIILTLTVGLEAGLALPSMIYYFDPYNNIDPAQRKQVLGGHCLGQTPPLGSLRWSLAPQSHYSSFSLRFLFFSTVIGQASLWFEQTEKQNMGGIICPSALSTVKLYWTSTQQGQSVMEELPCIHNMRYWFLQRGIRAAPCQPHWCAIRPGQCNLPPLATEN
ncbi:hypothetical protein PCANC_12539, partial [Puccinia coronata f. sp. avenae]